MKNKLPYETLDPDGAKMPERKVSERPTEREARILEQAFGKGTCEKGGLADLIKKSPEWDT